MVILSESLFSLFEEVSEVYDLSSLVVTGEDVMNHHHHHHQQV
jgi:hypothetical protein